MARSALSFDFMAVTPLDEPPQPQAHAPLLWMRGQPKSILCDPSPGSLSGRVNVGV